METFTQALTQVWDELNLRPCRLLAATVKFAASTVANNPLPSVLLISERMGYAKVWSLQGEHFVKVSLEDSHSGLVRTPGTRVG